MRIAPATVPEREARKIAAEYLRPQNQGLELIGSATNFSEYVDNTYKPLPLPLTWPRRLRNVREASSPITWCQSLESFLFEI